MAQFTKVNGTTQPVFALDVANGSIAGTANVAAQGPVMLSGPQLQFFTLTANAALTNAGNVNGYLNNVLQAVQQTGTVAFYQAGAAAGTIKKGAAQDFHSVHIYGQKETPDFLRPGFG